MIVFVIAKTIARYPWSNAMPLPQSVNENMTKVETYTTELGTTVLALRDQIKVGMSQENVDLVNGFLTAHGNALVTLAKNPEDPIPPGPTPVFAAKRK